MAYMEPALPALRYRPIHRTPPDYQIVIKLLLVACLLDAESLWADGPPMAAELPPATREALEHLGVAEQDWPSPGGSPRSPPLVIRVLGLLLFNSCVLWTDLGSVILGAGGAAGSSSIPALRPPPICDLATSASSSSWCNASDPRHEEFLIQTCSVGAAAAAPAQRSGAWASGAVQWARGALRGVLEVAGPVEGVPWLAQLVSLVLLVLVVCAVPRCPIVLENACNFLMC